MSSDRRYTEAEVRAIFERAAARQESVQRAEDAAGPGLTLEELQEIGAAAGIAPAHVAAAAAEVGLARPAPPPLLLGMPVEIEHTRVLPGPVSDDVWARMVAELRRAFRDDGAAGQIGPVREWTAVGRGLRRDVATRLTVEPDGGRTRVTLRQSTREVARVLTLSGAITAAVAILCAVLAVLGVDPAETWAAAAITAVLAAAFLGGTRAGMRLWARRQEQQFDAVLDRIELVARGASPESAVAWAGPDALENPPAPRLDLDALPDAEPGASGAARRDRLRT
jgi:hypothetical protein